MIQRLPVDPYVLSMIVCDAIYYEKYSGKRSLIGISTAVSSREYPFVHPQLCIHAELTEGYGKVELRFKIVDVDEDDDPVAETTVHAEFDDPRNVILLALTLERVQFNHPGEYRVQCYCGGNLLLERRLQAIKLEDSHE